MLFFLFSTVYCTSIHALTKANFVPLVYNYGVNAKAEPAADRWFVSFMTPGCAECTKVEGLWEELAVSQQSQVHPLRVNYGRVNCAEDAQLCTMFNIDKHPSLVLIDTVTRESVFFDGVPTAPSVERFAREVLFGWEDNVELQVVVGSNGEMQFGTEETGKATTTAPAVAAASTAPTVPAAGNGDGSLAYNGVKPVKENGNTESRDLPDDAYYKPVVMALNFDISSVFLSVLDNGPSSRVVNMYIFGIPLIAALYLSILCIGKPVRTRVKVD